MFSDLIESVTKRYCIYEKIQSSLIRITKLSGQVYLEQPKGEEIVKLSDIVKNDKVFRDKEFWSRLIHAKIFTKLPLNRLDDKNVMSILESQVNEEIENLLNVNIGFEDARLII